MGWGKPFEPLNLLMAIIEKPPPLLDILYNNHFFPNVLEKERGAQTYFKLRLHSTYLTFYPELKGGCD
uniref:Uncharacterized protein n=2 Tax=Picea TaxID=3328 RepID=A0A117NGQ2_PICGL|nr:hypothetical protein ABT39_MTgene6144 [Picea glauca]QHR92792.1 hypothetical protein Q903MT_gene6840 [Picea sitchensis]